MGPRAAGRDGAAKSRGLGRLGLGGEVVLEAEARLGRCGGH